MKKFRTQAIRYSPIIITVDVESETDSFIVIKGRRVKKRTAYDNYFDSFEEAFDYCYSELNKQVNDYADRLHRAERIRDDFYKRYIGDK